ncbi:aldo/keto reductase [Siccirubricoccus phaeus]|uniref:aldo/keto reductase n=1 Tax=Siccirubricoccus phaeus TaxID=2595053 RepID=UPI0011F1B429|nr:aldo/keto reductase [Siccirubricoccus phaeus]
MSDVQTSSAAADAVDRVRLANTPLDCSRLGYGTAALMGRLGRRRSVELLRCAYDSGVTHFDTARSYGYGEAEVAVGDLAQAVGRDRITIATKFGILPPRRSPALTAAKAVARVLTAALPGLRRAIGRRAYGMVQGGAFDLATATASVEASLRALRTDHIDLLLMHECAPEDRTEEMLTFLDRLLREGKIRSHGVATQPGASRAILLSPNAPAPVVQVPDSPLSPTLPGLLAGLTAPPGCVTHSALGARFAELRARLAADPALARRWSDRLGFDVVGNPDRLGGLCLAAALAANPQGVVLFSSTRETHIRANAKIGTARATAAARPAVGALRALLAEAAPAAAPIAATLAGATSWTLLAMAGIAGA